MLSDPAFVSSLISDQREGCRNISDVGCHRSLSAGGSESLGPFALWPGAPMNPYKGDEAQRPLILFVFLSSNLHSSTITLFFRTTCLQNQRLIFSS